MKDVHIVTSGRLGKIIWSLRNSSMDLLTLLVMYFKCSPKFNLLRRKYRGILDIEFDLHGSRWLPELS